ncbi:dihydrofolate reductase family protein [Micromonospora sp. NPDC003241]
MSDRPAGKVLWHATVSLDGYIAASGDDVTWVFDHFDPEEPTAAAVVERTGAVIAGRRSYEAGERDGRKVFDGAWSGPQYLLTHRPTEQPLQGVAVRAGDVTPVVDEARIAATGRDVLIIGADVASQCLAAGLVDEVIVHIAPILLGNGVRFRGPDEHTHLTLMDVSRHKEIVTLHYHTGVDGPSRATRASLA